jgi:hypothetical protein
MTFSNWNAPVSVTAPTDVIDVSKLATVGDASGMIGQIQSGK